MSKVRKTSQKVIISKVSNNMKLQYLFFPTQNLKAVVIKLKLGSYWCRQIFRNDSYHTNV